MQAFGAPRRGGADRPCSSFDVANSLQAGCEQSVAHDRFGQALRRDLQAVKESTYEFVACKARLVRR